MNQGVKTTFSLLAVFLTVWLGSRFLLPLTAPFFLGTALALAAEPMVAFLHRRLRLPRAVSAGIGVTVVFCFLALTLLTLCAFLIRELGLLAGVLPNLADTARSGISLLRRWTLNLTAQAPEGLRPLLQNNVTTLFSDGTALLDKAVQYSLGLAGTLLTHIPNSAFTIGTAVIAGFMISGKLPRIKKWVRRRIPKEKLRPLLSAFSRIKTAALGWLTAQCKLMGTTALILFLGFLLLRVPYAPLWALGVALVDALPVLGTGMILLPWSLICFLQANNARAIGLIGIYITAALTRSALEPKLLGSHLGLDPLVTLMALYAGCKLWGIGGMVIAPLLAVTTMQLLPEKNQR